MGFSYIASWNKNKKQNYKLKWVFMWSCGAAVWAPRDKAPQKITQPWGYSIASFSPHFPKNAKKPLARPLALNLVKPRVLFRWRNVNMFGVSKILGGRCRALTNTSCCPRFTALLGSTDTGIATR